MSSTAVNEIDERDLAHELNVAYGDLSYVLARPVAIEGRIHPRERSGQLLFNAVAYINGEFDNIAQKAEAMRAEPAHPPAPPRPRSPR